MTDKPSAAAPAHDRRHDGSSFQGKGPEGLHSSRRELQDFLGRSPDTATSEDLRLFQLHMTRSHVGAPSIMRDRRAPVLFSVTLERPTGSASNVCPRTAQIADRPEPRGGRAPMEAAPASNTRPRSASYGAGLRVSEVVSLKVSDIDSTRMMLRVEDGKGGKDRHAMLSPRLLELLRDCGASRGRKSGCFPGLTDQPMSTRQLNRACHAAAHMAEITKRVTAYAAAQLCTHLLEQNIDIRVIQVCWVTPSSIRPRFTRASPTNHPDVMSRWIA